MPCNGITCAQGRKPCATPDRCASRHTGASATTLHQHNSDGTHRDDTTPTPLPWEWIDDLRDFVVLAPIAAVLCGMAAMALGALVGLVLKG